MLFRSNVSRRNSGEGDPSTCVHIQVEELVIAVVGEDQQHGLGTVGDADMQDRIRDTIRRHTTPRHVPARILAVPDIPRTLSGKIVELAVRDVVHGLPVTNTDALANPAALAHFRDRPELAI